MCSRIILAAALLIASGIGVGRAQSPILKRDFRGVWLSTVANIDWPTSPGLPVETQQQQLVAWFDNLAAAGFNVVVFQVRPECDALYQSSIEPWSYWLTGVQGLAPNPPWDPLQFAIDEAHKRGMELHAWFNPYRAVHGSYAGTYQRAANHVSVAHPDWILTGISSSPATKILDPGKQVVRNYVAGVIADVVRRYDVDGAHMDDYFYVEGITTQDAATFAAEPRGFTILADWRRDNVNLLIHQVYDSIQAIKPWVKWGMSPRGIWRNNVPPGITGNDNYSSIYCDALAWLGGRYIDYIAPQLYWKFGGGQDYALLQPWWASQRNTRHFYPGLATYRIGDVNFGTASEIARQIRFNRSPTTPTQGSIQFTANNIRDNRGGITDSLRNDLHRYRAILPAMTWKDSINPNPPGNLRYARLGSGPAALQWDLPAPASDGDTAYRYVVYRFDHMPGLPGDIDSSRYINAVEGKRNSNPVASTGGPYYFVVTSLDRNYNESAPGTPLVVSAPAPPLLATPVNGADDLPPMTTVTWHAEPLAAVYHVQVATDSTFASGFLVNDSSVVDTFKTLASVTGQERYFWRVRSRNAGGTGSFGSAWHFSTGFPEAPVLAYPGNFEVNIPITATYHWAPAAGAASYRVQVSTAATFSPLVVDTAGITDTSLVVGPLSSFTIYYWRVNATNVIGTSLWPDGYKFRTVLQMAVNEPDGFPSRYELEQNYPNPFNPTTVIQFAVARAGAVSLKVYDMLGREVATLVDDERAPGVYTVQWNAIDLPSGVYLYRLVTGGFTETKRMVLVK